MNESSDRVHFVVMDTNSLMYIREERRTLEHIFRIKNCFIIVPQHVFAELDCIAKYRKNDNNKKGQQGANAASDGIDDMEARNGKRYELARTVAADIAKFLPAHLQRVRDSFSRSPSNVGGCEPHKLFLTAKDRAEKIVFDKAQHTLESDNRILEFAKSVVDTVGDNGKVLFVTDDNILFSLACYQLGDINLVCRPKDWEGIVRNAQQHLSSPVGSNKPIMPSRAIIDGSDDESDATPASNASPPSQNTPPLKTTRAAAPPAYESLSHQQSTAVSPQKGSKKLTPLQEHIMILRSVSEEEIDQQLRYWESKNIPFEDRQMAAYYVYRRRRETDYCTRYNGPLDYCNHEATTGEGCIFIHKCLFCGEEGHGWSNYNKCDKYRALEADMESPYISTDDMWRMVREKYDPYTHDHKRYEALPPNGPVSSPPAVAEPMAMAVAATPFSEVAATKAPPTPAKRFTLKMNSFPKTKQGIVSLFSSEKISSEKRDELKPLIRYIFRLALGHKADDPYWPQTNHAFPRFLSSTHSLTGLAVCVPYNNDQPCDAQCNKKATHSCLFCGSLHGHGWKKCEARIQLEEVIKELAFDLSKCDESFHGMTPGAVLEMFVEICAGRRKADDKPDVLMSDKSQMMLDRLVGADASLVRKLEDMWAGQNIHFPASFKTYLAASFVTAPNKHPTKHACLYHNLSECGNGDKCTYAHQCTHCGSKAHGWTRCPDHLEFCLDMKRLGFTDEKIGEHIVSLQKKTNKK